MPARIVAYHRTEELQDGTFIPQVQILSPSGEDVIDARLRDDDHPCAAAPWQCRRLLDEMRPPAAEQHCAAR
jgi:hypothetical protein